MADPPLKMRVAFAFGTPLPSTRAVRALAELVTTVFVAINVASPARLPTLTAVSGAAKFTTTPDSSVTVKFVFGVGSL